MKPEHLQDLEQFRRLFKDENTINYSRYLKIFEAFLQTENHITLDELHKLVLEKDSSFTSDEIDETMRTLVKSDARRHCQGRLCRSPSS